jgi:hypothetical protein
LKTSKAFSTISYNTAEFLKLKLDELVAKRCIAFYAYVFHYAEEDEKKDHKHLLIIPNGQIDTDQIGDVLQELDPANIGKPLGCMPFHSSKWGDWFLYSSHDSAYLASKGQTRKHHYTEKDFVASDEDYLHELITTIDRTKYAKTQDFVQKVKGGASFFEMLQNGQIPAPQFNQWLNMFEYIRNGEVYRNGRQTHSPNIDPETGEVLNDNKDTTD